jgi:outer membrane lipoprotein carrier protein
VIRRADALVALILLLLAPPLRAQTATAAAILQRTADTYRQLTSFTAEFEQVVSSEMIGTFKSRGTLAQAGASRLSMRFADPPGEAIVIDGTSIWIYTPSTAPGQVLRMPIARASSYGVNLLAWLLDRPTERYRVTLVRLDEVGGTPVDVLQMTPVVEGLPFTSARLWLARSDALPRRVEVTEPSGNHRTLTLAQIRTNTALPPATFTFTPPKGVKVIDQ